MDTLVAWVNGRFSPSTRIWGAAAPALVIVGYFVLGLVVYLVRGRLRGPYRDAELANRGSSVLIGMALRHYFAWLMQPIWSLLRTFDVPAMALTTLSALLATASGLAVADGRFTLGGWVYVFAGLCDFFDGRIARHRGTAGPSGAALDSVLDRYSDAALLVGLAWYYRESWVLLAVLVLMIGAFLVPYVRARGEGLGIKVTVGLMQRPERTLYLGLAVAFAPILEALYVPSQRHPQHFLAALTITILAVATMVTAVQRLLYLLRALSEDRPRLLRQVADVAQARARLLRFSFYSLVATLIDAAAFWQLVEHRLLTPWLATIAACILGGLANALINRFLKLIGAGLPPQRSGEYAFVSATGALLNGGGVALLLRLPGLHYLAAWLLVRLAVLLAWNYPLNRDYLFELGAVEEDDGEDAPAIE